MPSSAPVKIGISAAFFHPDPKRTTFNGKRLLYVVESLAHWVMSQGALAFLIPSENPNSPVRLKDFIDELDGLVLQGGADVSPKSYSEEPLRDEWSGDFVRDEYEIELVRHCVAAQKPVLGLCRGIQVINVAFGGTLYQDITTQVPSALTHRNAEIYDQNFHRIEIVPGSHLESLFPKTKTAKVNSVHHQGVKELGKNLVVEATSEKDGMIEAIRLKSDSFVFGVQWHPEFQDPKDRDLLDTRPILNDFMTRVRKEKKRA